MKARKYISFFLVLTLVALLVSGCGGSSKNYSAGAYPMAPAEMRAEDAESYEMAAPNPGSGSSQLSLPSGRKWVITVNMDAETEDMDALLSSVNGKIAQLGGYVENQNIHNGSAYSSRRYRSASLTVRIPVEKLSEFTEEVRSISNVVTNNQSARDVTLNYVDTESHLAALKVEESRLLALMEQAENMTDLLEIESRLTDVRYELERYGSNLRVLDNQIDFATIYLDIEEVQEYTPVVEQTVWQRISEGFVSNLKDLGETIVNIIVWLIVTLPYLVVLGLVIWGISALSRAAGKRRRAKAESAAPKKTRKFPWKQQSDKDPENEA